MRKRLLKWGLSAVLMVVMVVMIMPLSTVNVGADSVFIQQNILQVNANDSNDYISGDWYSLTNGAGNIRDLLLIYLWYFVPLIMFIARYMLSRSITRMS